jgi:hypothetical protein
LAEQGNLDLYICLHPISSPPDLDPEFIYPEGDSYIPIDPIGAVILIAEMYFQSPQNFKEVLGKIAEPPDLLVTYIHLITNHLDDTSLNIVDAITFLGLYLLALLSPSDIPDLKDPDSPSATEFFTCLQVQALRFYLI